MKILNLGHVYYASTNQDIFNNVKRNSSTKLCNLIRIWTCIRSPPFFGLYYRLKTIEVLILIMLACFAACNHWYFFARKKKTHNVFRFAFFNVKYSLVYFDILWSRIYYFILVSHSLNGIIFHSKIYKIYFVFYSSIFKCRLVVV